MPNYCEYEIHVRGKKENCKKFHQIIICRSISLEYFRQMLRMNMEPMRITVWRLPVIVRGVSTAVCARGHFLMPPAMGRV